MRGGPGPGGVPVALQRVEEITGRSVTFREADLRDQEALRKVFTEVKDGGDRIGEPPHLLHP